MCPVCVDRISPNKVVPGLGYFIAFLVSLGGLVFNIGNVGGAATGFNIVFGFPLKVGTVVAGVIGILIFLSKDAKNFMDKLTKYLGSIMIVTVLYVAFRSKPPVVEAISSVGHLNEFPNLVFPIITLLGGSCGGYITFSGAHRLLDAGFSGTKDLPHVRRSVLMGISVSGVMRILLFLAVLGVVTATPEVVGSEAWVASPPAAAFKAGSRHHRLQDLRSGYPVCSYHLHHRCSVYIRILLKDPASVHHGE